MDVIRDFTETAIDKINMPTLAAFIPILEERKADTDKIQRKEFQYGPKNRHYLDVYYPPTNSALTIPTGKRPVLFFIYGGGYNTGSRRFPEPYDMGYRALGAFFAARGFVVVIPDYRLVPEVRFPAASEDLRDALVWVANNADTVGDLDPGYVFMLAHSAGAAHTLVLHLYPPLCASLVAARGTGLRVRGLVLSGSPWLFSVRGETFVTTGPVKFYFGNEAQQKEREPRGLWAAFAQGQGEEDLRAFPDVMLIQAEREPEWLSVQTKGMMEREMREGLERVKRTLGETYIAAGHNHVSVNWGLGTGDVRAEQWGYDVVDWIKARLTRDG